MQCKCGKDKPRRYSACAKCWEQMTEQQKRALEQSGSIRQYKRAGK